MQNTQKRHHSHSEGKSSTLDIVPCMLSDLSTSGSQDSSLRFIPILANLFNWFAKQFSFRFEFNLSGLIQMDTEVK